jgi:SNF2 family DNA or RNA helicase
MGFYRIDGKTSQKTRDEHRNEFNQEGSTHKVMILAVASGGLGLTLTGADTVILLGPNWNPKVDEQAVGRAYRIGQTKPVNVYRINMAGLVDEKVSRLSSVWR